MEGTRSFEDESLARRMFAEGEMAGAGVEDQIDGVSRQVGSRARCDPRVATDFEADTKPGQFEDEVPDRHIDAGKRRARNHAGRPGREPSRFVMDTLPGQILFADQSRHSTIDDQCRSVIETASVPQRQPDRHDHLLALFGHLEQRSLRTLPKGGR